MTDEKESGETKPGETKSGWKSGLAVLIGSLAALITAVAALLPEIRAFFSEEDEVAAVASAPETGSGNSAGAADRDEEASTSPTDSTLSDQQARQSAERHTAKFFDALSRKDLDYMMSLVELPFFMDQGSLITNRQQFRRKIIELFNENARSDVLPSPDSIKVYTIAEAREKGLTSDSDRAISRLTLTDEDLLSIAMFGGEGVALYYRRKPDGIGLAAIWD